MSALFSQEHYDLMAFFERQHKGHRLDREDKASWKAGYVYQDGAVNNLFLAFRHGAAYGSALARPAVMEAAPAVPAAPYKLAGDRMEIWNNHMHDLQTRLEICAGSVAFARSVAANMRRQRDEAKAALAALSAAPGSDGGEGVNRG